MITLDEFLALPTEKVANLVRAAGPQVCVFPINGTRRWFMLEYGNRQWDDPICAYMDIAAANHISLCKLIFDHGVDTLLTPTLGPDILLRGEEYMARIGSEGLARLAQGPDFMKFYAEYDVRVHFYGDHRKALASTPYAHLSDLFDQAAERTRNHKRFRLFFGIFGNDAAEAVAEFAVKYYQQHGKSPDRRAIVAMYYGEYVEPATFFIGFDKFSAFDYPLLNLGEEALYFTVSPSLYLSQRQLRLILYDYLYARSAPEPDYDTLSTQAKTRMRAFYRANEENVFGLGVLYDGIWYPCLAAEDLCKPLRIRA
jgi:tuberculosinol/isotuberculosinol synthase